MNELDRFVTHYIKPRAYVRYGDDFVIILDDLAKLIKAREEVTLFLRENLFLKINDKNDIIVKAKWGLKFLGVKIFPKGRRLNKRNVQRIKSRISEKNLSSYAGLLKKHSNDKKIKHFNWALVNNFFND